MNTLLFAFELFIVLPYTFFAERYSSFSFLLNICLIGLFFLESLFFMFEKKGKRVFSKVEALILFFGFFQFIVTIYFKSMGIIEISLYFLKIVILVLMLIRGCSKYPIALLRGITLYFGVAIVVNFVLILLFPDGIYTIRSKALIYQEHFFLGVANRFGYYFFPGFSIIWFYDYLKNGKSTIISVFFLSCIILSNLIVKDPSSTGLIISFFLCFLFVLFNNVKFIVNVLSLGKLLLINLTTELILISGVAVFYDNQVISNIVQMITGKDLSFSGRVVIWLSGFLQFLNQPWFGYGKYPGNLFVSLGWREYSAHNTILQILIESGIIGFVLFLMILFILCLKSKRAVFECPHLRILYFGMFCLMSNFMMETFDLFTLFILILLISLFFQIKNYKMWNNPKKNYLN